MAGTTPGAGVPGKRTLTQLLGESSKVTSGQHADAHQIAARGVAGAGATLPHAEKIQPLFGRHDVSHVTAHTDGAAGTATRDLGARAYASGSHVAFDHSPDLHTAAHEAAHVIQQAGGSVQLKGGVGNAGDPYERHADAVADRVVAGHSAEGLLDQMAGEAGSTTTPSIQRVVGPRPKGDFCGNLAWATWFQAMTAEEVGAEASKLGLEREVLDHMNKVLERNGQDPIKIPGAHAGPSDAPAGDGTEAAAEPSMSTMGGGLSMGPVAVAQSPFRFGSVAAPVDASEKPARASKVRRREVLSPIKYIIYNKLSEPDKYASEDRKKSLSSLPGSEFNFCFAHAREAIRRSDGLLAITLSPGRHISFTTGDPELLGEELAAIHAVRYEEPEPRSGAARAAADDEEGTFRCQRDVQAPYAGPTEDLGAAESYGDYTQEVESSVFTSTIQSGMIINEIVHRGPWAKGERVPSQMGVMAGQNAKNYFLDHFMYEGHKGPTQEERQADLDELGGRFEWLHIIGSSLGGPNVLGNLVCGTYDANTEMIALEHRVARWGSRAYKGSFRPTPEKPLKIVGVAVLEGPGFVAKQITMHVYHGTELVLARNYEALQPTVLTKAKYKLAEQGIEADIEKVRGGKKDDTDGAGTSSGGGSTAAAGKML